jgi:hypothetical protein
MTVSPEVPPEGPAFRATLQMSPTGMKILGWGAPVALTLWGVATGTLSWDEVRIVLSAMPK